MRETPLPHIPLEGDPTPFIKMKVLNGARGVNLPTYIKIPNTSATQKRADDNHGQSLETLNSRGGLCPSEAIAILENTKFFPKSKQEQVSYFAERPDLWLT